MKAHAYVQFGFFRGSALRDPRGLLEGGGRYVRRVKVRAPSEIEPSAFGALLGQAAGSRRRRRTSPSEKKPSRRAGVKGARRP